MWVAKTFKGINVGSTLHYHFIGLKEQLNKAKSNVEQYKSIADSVEKNLKEQNEAMEKFKQSTEEKLKEATEGKIVVS